MTIGISEDLLYLEKAKIRILNQCTWLCIIGAFILMLYARYMERADFVVEITSFTLFTLPLFFHWQKNYILARLIATVFFPVFTLGLAIMYGPKSSVEFIYFAIILTVLIMYDAIWAKILNIIGIVIVFCANFYYWENYAGAYPMDASVFHDIVVFFFVTLAMASIFGNFFNAYKESHQKQLSYNITLADRNEKLEHFITQNETKNQLIQIVAHDLKAPAASFLNLTQKISYLIRTEQPHRLIDIASHFETSGTNFFYTLDNLLNWVIAQQDGITINDDIIDLNSLIAEMEKNVRFLFTTKKIKVVSLVPDDTLICADRNIIKILLNNLLHNAAKFSPENEKIIISYEVDNGFHKIAITDFGVGMDKETQRIILKGTLFHSTVGTSHEKGHGLGLKICFRMIRFLNGRIGIQSRKGEGCQMTISIPRKDLNKTPTEGDSIIKKTKSKLEGQAASDQ